MGRIQTVAALVGAAAGALAIAGVYLFGVGRHCGVISCINSTFATDVDQGVAVVLVLASAVSFVGPKKVFYASAALCAVLAVLILGSDLTPPVLLTVTLTAGAFVLNVVAARWETKVSEQSNPMNLPVFG